MNLIGVLLGVVVFLVGLVVCFYGAQWSKYVIFFIAFAAMFYLLNRILGSADMSQNTRTIVCVIVSLIVGLLCIFGYNWGPWILGAAVGIMFACNIDLGIQNEIFFYLWVAAAAVIFAVLCVVLKDLMMKILTGLSGGVFIVGACVYVVESFQGKAGSIIDYFQGLFAHVFSSGSATGIAIACIIVGVLGILVQFGILPNPIRR